MLDVKKQTAMKSLVHVTGKSFSTLSRWIGDVGLSVVFYGQFIKWKGIQRVLLAVYNEKRYTYSKCYIVYTNYQYYIYYVA